MGLAYSRLLEFLRLRQTEARIFIAGLDASGKTTLLYKLHPGEIISVVPTIGFNVETVVYNKIKLIMWDMGGGDKIRSLFPHLMTGANGVIFVVDSTDRYRLDEAKACLFGILNMTKYDGLPLLVYANKQDVSGSMTLKQIVNGMELRSLRNRLWKIQTSCATNGKGLCDGLEWLTAALTTKSVRRSSRRLISA